MFISKCQSAARTTAHAILALALAGSLWGLTVPLSKLGMEWLDASWLAVVRFAVAAPLLALFARRRPARGDLAGRDRGRRRRLGGVILLQNAGIQHTSVTHAALIVGAVPVLVAMIAAALGRGTATAAAWVGSLVALAGVGLVAGGGGAGTSLDRRPARARLGLRLGGVHRRPAAVARGT